MDLDYIGNKNIQNLQMQRRHVEINLVMYYKLNAEIRTFTNERGLQLRS